MNKQFGASKGFTQLSGNKAVEIFGIYEIEKTRQNFYSYLDMLGYDVEEHDLSQTNQGSKKELKLFGTGYRFINDMFAIKLTFKFDMSGVDVQVDGKIKSKGMAVLVMSAYLHEDPYGKESGLKSSWEKFWYHLFNKFHYEHMQSDAMIEVFTDVSKVISYFKKEVGSKV